MKTESFITRPHEPGTFSDTARQPQSLPVTADEDRLKRQLAALAAMGIAGSINTIIKPDLPIPERLRLNGRRKPESSTTRVRLGSEIIPSFAQSSPFETGRGKSGWRTRPVRLSPGIPVTLSLINAGSGEAGRALGIRSVAPRRAGSGGKK